MDALDLWNKLKSIPPTQNRLAIQLIEDYSTMIRKECADRAVEWCGQYDGFMPGNDDTELRAAIEGKKE